MLLVIQAEAANGLDVFTGEGGEKESDILTNLAPLAEGVPLQ